jgi:Flp pilus assembly protein TadG
MVEVKKRCPFWRCEKGAQLVEFALVLPLLLLVTLGIAEFGFIFHRYEVLTNAAREGARIAVLPNYATADVQERVGKFLDAGRFPAAGRSTPVAVVTYPTLTLADGTEIEMARVTVTYTYTYMFVPAIAGWFGSSYTTQQMSAVSEMRLEVPGM